MTLLLERVTATETPAPAVEIEDIELALAAHTIQRVAADPFFMGHTFAACNDRFDMDERSLASFLGCPIGGLTTMALFARPDRTLPGFCHSLRRIAAAGGADPSMLLTLLELTEPVPSCPG